MIESRQCFRQASSSAIHHNANNRSLSIRRQLDGWYFNLMDPWIFEAEID